MRKYKNIIVIISIVVITLCISVVTFAKADITNIDDIGKILIAIGIFVLLIAFAIRLIKDGIE